MQTKKKGFWLFIFSLIPGAGEMYMGFTKKGVSIMSLFCVIFALASGLGIGWITFVLPVIWFYSFFDTHNLKNLPDEEFYSLEDEYILNMEHIGKESQKASADKWKTAVAILMIVFSASILWNYLLDILYWILPEYLANRVWSIFGKMPQIVIAIFIFIAGCQMLTKNRRKDSKEPLPHMQIQRKASTGCSTTAETEFSRNSFAQGMAHPGSTTAENAPAASNASCDAPESSTFPEACQSPELPSKSDEDSGEAL